MCARRSQNTTKLYANSMQKAAICPKSSKNNENCVLLMRSEPKCIDFIRLCYIFYNLEAPAEGLEANALGFCPGGGKQGRSDRGEG